MSYTSGRTVKSTARKLDAGLTVQKATRDARRCVEVTVPGVGATVNSRIGWDTALDRQTVVTTVTFPANQAGRTGLALLLADLSGVISRTVADSSITITRTV